MIDASQNREEFSLTHAQGPNMGSNRVDFKSVFIVEGDYLKEDKDRMPRWKKKQSSLIPHRSSDFLLTSKTSSIHKKMHDDTIHEVVDLTRNWDDEQERKMSEAKRRERESRKSVKIKMSMGWGKGVEGEGGGGGVAGGKEGDVLLWKRRNVKTFPSIKEPDMTKETPKMTALRRLRSRLRPYHGHVIYKQVVCLSDQDLLSWLNAYDLQIYTAEARILNHYFTRHKLGLDQVTRRGYQPSEILKTYYTGGICGQDKDHCPVWYEMLGSQEIVNLVAAVPIEEMVKYKFYQFEQIKHAARDAGVSNVLMVIDMELIPIKNFGPAIDIWKQFIEILQDHYPYLFKEIVIINLPQAWTEFALALRPYLNRQTRSKVTIIRNNCLKHLMHRIDRHEVPAYLGGYKCDIDNNPFCKECINWDGKVPLWMHRSDSINANVRPFVVPGGERLVKETLVTTPGSHVFWEILSVNQSVPISVYLERVEEDCLVIRQKITHEAGGIKNQVVGLPGMASGRYFMVIDNSKNYASAVKGMHTMTVHLPPWLNAKGAKKKALGELFRLDTFIGEEERKVLAWKHSREPHFTWKQDQVSP